jgi:hypothetical protein
VAQVNLTATLTYTGIDTPFVFGSTTFVVFNALSSPLIARIRGGDRNVWADAAGPNAVLDASLSYDPDDPTGVRSEGNPMMVSWTCQRAVSLRPCFDPAMSTDMFVWSTVLTLSLAAPLFVDSSSDPFQFQALLAKDNRQATSQMVTVTAIFVALPQISIAVSVPTQGASWTRINPTDRVQLAGTTQQVGSTPITYGLQWFCYSNNFNMTHGLATSTTSPNLVLNSGFLQGGATYLFSLLLYSVANPKQQTQSNISFTVNQVPLGGSCSSNPATGVAMEDTFALNCRDWVSSSTPLEYSFAVIDSKTQLVTMTLRDFQAVGTFSAKLQAGDPLLVQVTIRDRFGAQTLTVISVKVKQPDVSTPSAVSNLASTALSGLAMASQVGDLSAASQVC